MGDMSDLRLSASDLAWLHSLDLAISICTRMDELNLSKGELAQRAGMKASALSRIIAGEQNMTLSTIAKLEVALDMRFDQGFRYAAEEIPGQRSSISGVISTPIGVNQGLDVIGEPKQTGSQEKCAERRVLHDTGYPHLRLVA